MSLNFYKVQSSLGSKGLRQQNTQEALGSRHGTRLWLNQYKNLLCHFILLFSFFMCNNLGLSVQNFKLNPLIQPLFLSTFLILQLVAKFIPSYLRPNILRVIQQWHHHQTPQTPPPLQQKVNHQIDLISVMEATLPHFMIYLLRIPKIPKQKELLYSCLTIEKRKKLPCLIFSTLVNILSNISFFFSNQILWVCIFNYIISYPFY